MKKGIHMEHRECQKDHSPELAQDPISSVLSTVHIGKKPGHIGIAVFCLQIEQYKHILAFIFAVDEINKNPTLLPNVTIGYQIVDTCGNARKSLKSSIQIMSGRYQEVPNYSCGNDGEVAAFVANSGFHTNSALIQFLSLYKFTQMNYGPADPLLTDRVSHPTLFHIASNDVLRYEAIVKCLEYFGWNWVGIITPEGGIGEGESVVLSNMMNERGICIDYIIKLEKENHKVNTMRMAKMSQSQAEVVVVCGLYYIKYGVSLSEVQMENITFIFHESWINSLDFGMTFTKVINCSFMFMLPRKQIPNFNVCQNVNPLTRPDDPLLEDLWYFLFNCLTKNHYKNHLFQQIHGANDAVNCTEEYEFPQVRYKDNNLYFVYTSVYILANALNRIVQRRTGSWRYGLRQKLSKYVQRVAYIDHSGEFIVFNKRGEVRSQWSLMNWALLKDGNNDYILYTTHLANFEEPPREFKTLHIDIRNIVWKKNRIPESRCNDPCSPGFRKTPTGRHHVCCYNCAPCSEGEVSNTSDSEICHKCPKDQFPDDKKVKCFLKSYEFLSYEKESLPLLFVVIVVILSVVTSFILISFIYFWETPLVKANNRTVSFILLVSILLSFLCVFFFLGRPVDITCLLRQVSFGIFFTIGVSSLLAKTITVCVAFKATKPGSSWIKWLSLNISISVVLVCSSIQVLMCVIWLLVSPPYVEYNHHTYPGKIIIQCNEGSDICFYSMLGYMGLLASVSFVLAFMVRTLPDSFNEAKYITFSMLLFCSVWIAMIPAYLSTRGKYMVAVETNAEFLEGRDTSDKEVVIRKPGAASKGGKGEAFSPPQCPPNHGE
ncbi:vomeronasal type-2 receptor 26-like [Engystomops pustulosus]|uniref:vomeronasal type-2 receptor 26-like n=1 Tax=Engystomops pustulosus TaxID=76066 RepID=UPI003AFA0816